jgi:hypothetical protein
MLKMPLGVRQLQWPALRVRSGLESNDGFKPSGVQTRDEEFFQQAAKEARDERAMPEARRSTLDQTAGKDNDPCQVSEVVIKQMEGCTEGADLLNVIPR